MESNWDRVEICKLGTNEIFGEGEYLSKMATRQLCVVANSDLVVFKLSYENLKIFSAKIPMFKETLICRNNDRMCQRDLQYQKHKGVLFDEENVVFEGKKLGYYLANYEKKEKATIEIPCKQDSLSQYKINAKATENLEWGNGNADILNLTTKNAYNRNSTIKLNGKIMPPTRGKHASSRVTLMGQT
jgi:hypothetical protein